MIELINEACKPKKKKTKKSKVESIDWSYYSNPKFDEIDAKYLPPRGEGDNMATQAVTAISKLVFKWYNDGDVFDNVTSSLTGWANDLSSCANWLAKYIPELKGYLNLDEVEELYTDSDYEDFLADLVEIIYNDKFLEKYEKQPKVGSIYDCNGPFKFREGSYEEDEDDEYPSESIYDEDDWDEEDEGILPGPFDFSTEYEEESLKLKEDYLSYDEVDTWDKSKKDRYLHNLVGNIQEKLSSKAEIKDNSLEILSDTFKVNIPFEDLSFDFNQLENDLNKVKRAIDEANKEDLTEDTVKKKSGKWVNRGEEGEHGEFKTKKEADAQRKAMFAKGYKGESLKEDLETDIEEYQGWVDYDLKEFGRVTDQTYREIDEAGLKVIVDNYGDFKVVSKGYQTESYEVPSLDEVAWKAEDAVDHLAAWMSDDTLDKETKEKVENNLRAIMDNIKIALDEYYD